MSSNSKKKVDQLDAQLHTEQELKKNIEELAELIKVGKTLQAQAGDPRNKAASKSP